MFPNSQHLAVKQEPRYGKKRGFHGRRNQGLNAGLASLCRCAATQLQHHRRAQNPAVGQAGGFLETPHLPWHSVGTPNRRCPQTTLACPRARWSCSTAHRCGTGAASGGSRWGLCRRGGDPCVFGIAGEAAVVPSGAKLCHLRLASLNSPLLETETLLQLCRGWLRACRAKALSSAPPLGAGEAVPPALCG